jgi:hypothetical protein
MLPSGREEQAPPLPMLMSVSVIEMSEAYDTPVSAAGVWKMPKKSVFAVSLGAFGLYKSEKICYNYLGEVFFK